MKVKCFGISRDIFNCDEILIDNAELNTVSDLRSYLNQLQGDMSLLKSYFIAVNQEYVDESHILSNDDEIAIIPPVSGG